MTSQGVLQFSYFCCLYFFFAFCYRSHQRKTHNIHCIRLYKTVCFREWISWDCQMVDVLSCLWRPQQTAVRAFKTSFKVATVKTLPWHEARQTSEFYQAGLKTPVLYRQELMSSVLKDTSGWLLKQLVRDYFWRDNIVFNPWLDKVFYSLSLSQILHAFEMLWYNLKSNPPIVYEQLPAHQLLGNINVANTCADHAILYSSRCCIEL